MLIKLTAALKETHAGRWRRQRGARRVDRHVFAYPAPVWIGLTLCRSPDETAKPVSIPARQRILIRCQPGHCHMLTAYARENGIELP
jgi:hypothetical protein